MRKIFTLVTLILFIGNQAFSQQDAQFTKYMFNSLVFNPAYAGAKDHMAIGLLHRTQWWGIDGAPTSQSFTVHTPLKSERVGVGLSAINDVIGPTHTMQANLSYSYRIPVGAGKLCIGLQGGVMNWRANWNKLTIEDPTDEAFAETEPSFWLPNFGAGLYYYSQMFYVGLGVPHLIEYDLREEPETAQYAKTLRHYYATIGAAFPLNGDALIFKPSLMVKTVGILSQYHKEESFQNYGTPTSFDIDLSFMFYQAFWIGAAFRGSVEGFGKSSSHDSVDIWASYYMMNGLRIGAAYDYTLTKLQGPAQGSFEVMLGYEFNYRTKKAVTPRYF